MMAASMPDSSSASTSWPRSGQRQALDGTIRLLANAGNAIIGDAQGAGVVHAGLLLRTTHLDQRDRVAGATQAEQQLQQPIADCCADHDYAGAPGQIAPRPLDHCLDG